MQTIDFTVVDAFTPVPFGGNPAAVVVLKKDHAITDKFMSLFAREMALAETAYTYEISPGRYSLRWFTPTIEVKLCGHATLATAHHLFEENKDLDAIVFETLSGELGAKKVGGQIQLEFPVAVAKSETPPEGLYAALRLNSDEVEFCGNNGMDVMVVIKGGHLAVKAVKPDMSLLEEIPTRCIIVTSEGGEDSNDIDFTSRVFGPSAGIPEDPVTGSAHCALAPYWSARLNKADVTGFQASARGGLVSCTICESIVQLKGPAVTVTKGSLVVPVNELL